MDLDFDTDEIARIIPLIRQQLERAVSDAESLKTRLPAPGGSFFGADCDRAQTAADQIAAQARRMEEQINAALGYLQTYLALSDEYFSCLYRGGS